MSKTITLTEHRPADGLLTMRVRNTTYNVNIFFNPNAKSTLDTQMRETPAVKSVPLSNPKARQASTSQAWSFTATSGMRSVTNGWLTPKPPRL